MSNSKSALFSLPLGGILSLLMIAPSLRYMGLEFNLGCGQFSAACARKLSVLDSIHPASARDRRTAHNFHGRGTHCVPRLPRPGVSAPFFSAPGIRLSWLSASSLL